MQHAVLWKLVRSLWRYVKPRSTLFHPVKVDYNPVSREMATGLSAHTLAWSRLHSEESHAVESKRNFGGIEIIELIISFLAGLMLSVYFANKDAPKGPSVNPGPPGWTSYGCYQDGNPRTLSHTDGSIQFSNMTVALCTSACGSNGYTLAGVEYSGECYCVC